MQDAGIDVASYVPGPDGVWGPLLEMRDGRWLRAKILGLLSADTRLARAFAPKEQGKAVT